MKKSYLLFIFVLLYQFNFAQNFIINKASNFGFAKNDTSSHSLNKDSTLTIEFSDVTAEKLLELLKKDSIKYDDGTTRSLFDISVVAVAGSGNSKEDERKILARIKNSNYLLDLKPALNDKPTSFKWLQLISANDKKEKIIVTLSLKQDNNTNQNITQNTNDPIHYIFIPTDRIESKWLQNINLDYLTPPALNKHTRWAITYDYTKQDPVAIWKRTNKIASTTCNTGALSTSKNKRTKNLTGIAKEIFELDTTLKNLQKNITDIIARQKIEKVREDINDLKSAINANSAKSIDDWFAKIEEIKKNIELINTLYPSITEPIYMGRIINGNTNNCCDRIYCVKQSKRLAPTVARNLLISVINYHPYKDSFTVAVDYNDNFLENAALFTSAFAALTGNSLNTTAATLDTTTTNKSQGRESKDSSHAQKYIYTLNQLVTELKYYYTSKYDQANLDVKVVENGVSYIKARMNEILSLTDFTETGIIKKGEEMADTIKTDPSISLTNYFAIVRDIANWFGKIANYKRFDGKSILVQNKDIMNITLNRYRDGRLMTIINEAARSYHTEAGFKLDFSLGLFGSSLIDKMYTTKSKETYDTSFFAASNGVVNRDSIVGIDTVQRKQIIRDKQGHFDIGPAVFLHGYWRTGWDINISGTFGLSINQSTNIRYLYGVSLLFGKDSRWAVSIGGVSGKIKDISSSYHEGQIIDPITENNGAVPTKDVTKSGWFLSMSWNFGGFSIGNNHQ